MIDYKNGKVYKIVSDQTNLIYVGSTAEPTLARRLAKHRSNYRNYLAKKTHAAYMTSYEILKYDDAKIVLLESCPCNNKDELRKNEQDWMIEYKAVLININGAILNIEGQKEQQREYRNTHREQLREKRIIYNEKNKEHIIEQNRQYREKNKEIIEEKYKALMTCQCGAIIQKISNYTHIKSQRHKNIMNQIEEEHKLWEHLTPLI